MAGATVRIEVDHAAITASIRNALDVLDGDGTHDLLDHDSGTPTIPG